MGETSFNPLHEAEAFQHRVGLNKIKMYASNIGRIIIPNLNMYYSDIIQFKSCQP